jgi:hypothetical protein
MTTPTTKQSFKIMSFIAIIHLHTNKLEGKHNIRAEKVREGTAAKWCNSNNQQTDPYLTDCLPPH